MPTSATFLFLTALLAAVWAHDANADKKTVCTHHRQFSRREGNVSPEPAPDKFQFVELVERGRPDWLESACRQGVRCDVLVISGHYDGGNEFYSDRAGGARVLARRRDGARLVQRFVLRIVLATEGSLSFRLQHAESAKRSGARPPRSGAVLSAPGIRGLMPSVCRAH